MPTRVGETVKFNMYERECDKRLPRAATVTRCTSDRGGLVYRVDSDDLSGGDSICGMD